MRHADRVLVVGGSGFIGSEVVRQALDLGMSVSVLARHRTSDRRRPWLDEVDWHVGSATEEVDIRHALADVGWVIDTVGCPPPATADFEPDSMLIQTLPTLSLLLDVLRWFPGVGVTYLSSGGAVYGNPGTRPVHESHRCAPISPYGATKLLAEERIRAHAQRYGIPARILRVSNAYGPLQSASDGQGLIAACMEASLGDRRITLFGDGRNVRDYVEIADVASAVLQLAPTLGAAQTVNVGTGVGLDVRGVVDLVGRVTELELDITWSPARSIDVRDIVLDTTLLQTLVPWEPRSIGDGLASAWRQRCDAETSYSRSQPA